jgi:endonuclease III
MMCDALKMLVEKYGEKYSATLGIDLSKARDTEVFKWFLASMLFGAPITESSVIKTYQCFKKYDVLTTHKIIRTGWDGLVRILDEGGYTRYDYKTADKLLEVSRNLAQQFDGSLSLLHQKASDPRDLEKRLKNLGKGVGDVTVGIFLRELRGIWKKSNPAPTGLVISAAKNLGIVKSENPENALRALERFWQKNRVKGRSFVEFETTLVRLGRDFRRKKKHPAP